MIRFLFLFLSTLYLAPGATMAAPQEDSSPGHETSVDRWLTAGPAAVSLPAFHDAEQGQYVPEDLFRAAIIAVADLSPVSGATLVGPDGSSLVWRETDAARFEPGAEVRVAWAATRLRTARFTEARLTVKSHQLLRVFLDGSEIAKNVEISAPAADGKETKPGQAASTLTLEPGDHVLLIETVCAGPTASDWSLTATLSREDAFAADAITAHTEAIRTLSVADLLDTEAPSWVRLSPDGRIVAIAYRRPEVPSDHTENWIEFRDTVTGKLLRSTEGIGDLSGFAWRPGTAEYSYVTRDDGKATVWRVAAAGGPVTAVLEGVEKFGSYRWTPDGASLIYTVTWSPKPNDSGMKRMRGLIDRLPGTRDRRHLYQAFADGGVRRRLTAGPLSTRLQDIHPASGHLLFTRTRHGLTTRPFSETELHELDLASLETRRLLTSPTLNGASYSPDGRRMLLRGGVSLVDSTPVEPPNDYDGQLFILDRDGGIDHVSRDFDPSLSQAVWSRQDGQIYLRAGDRSRVGLFRYAPDEGIFRELATGFDVVSGLSLASDADVAACFGSSAATPPGIETLRLSRIPEVLTRIDPGQETWGNVRFGRVEDWTFTSSGGDEIDGRVHYPPDFDPSASYPLLVYYYGGTSPITRNFGGRYPKNLWAANGYVVYVLNPSGATGFGQEFSNRHVNDWGRTTVGEIIEGTTEFLDAHPFVDRRRVGCLGASYGGFMTMLLVSQTDIFSAAIAHAGISSLSSYWGEGFWGYQYSAVATADSYPWNRPDLYVGQSPLFHADRIHTPLLLLHGEDDTNVPVGESEQLYTALRLLGREVEFVRIAGQNHHILQYPKRKLWMKTIVAWFDRELKDQPEWWNHLYNETADE